MKKYVKKKLAIVLSAVLIFSTLANVTMTQKAQAQTISSVSVGANVTAWVMDSASSHIDAVTDGTTNNLISINTNTMQIDHQMNVGSSPSDIQLDNNKLYIPLSGATQISVVDSVYLQAGTPINTANAPYKIAVDGNKLYYVQQSNFSYPYFIDMANGNAESQVGTYPTSSLYIPALTIDKLAQKLYVGESSSGGKLVSYDTSTNTLINQSNYGDGNGFPNPYRKVIVDGNDAFYAGHKLNKSDLTIVDGEYKSGYYQSSIVYVKGNYVFTDSAVFDRNTFAKITDLPYTTNFALMDNSNNVYLFNPTTQKVEKVSLNLTLNTQGTYSIADNKLNVPHPITDMEYNDASGKLLAISQDANKLLYINGTSLNVDHELMIGSEPSDMELYNNQIYVALEGSSKLAVTDAVYSGNVSLLNVASSNPRKIAVGQNEIYFVPEYSGSGGRYVYVYHRSTGISEKITYSDAAYRTYSMADLMLDDINQRLYIGETHATPTDLYMITPSTGGQYQLSSLSADYNAQHKFIKDGSNIFYDSYNLDAVTLTQVNATYTEPVIYAKTYNSHQYVFTSNSVYDGTTKLFDLPFTIDLATMASDGSVFLYSSAKSGIYRYNTVDEIKIPRAVASNVQVADLGTTTSSFAGAITWDKATPDESYISGYNVYFLDANNAKLGTAIGQVNKDVTVSNYTLTIPNNSPISVPTGATKIGVYTQNQWAESNKVATFDVTAPTALASNVVFPDTNLTIGQITGTISWDKAVDESNLTGYNVYFLDQSNTKLGNPIAQVSKDATLTNYSFVIPSTNPLTVPQGATKLGVYSKKLWAESTNPATSTLWDETYFVYGDKLVDNDPNVGINGTYTWTPPTVNNAMVKDYKVFYSDANKNRIGSAIATASITDSSVSITNVPSNAAYITMYAESIYGDNNPPGLNVVQTFDLITAEPVQNVSKLDLPYIVTNGLSFSDTDPNAGSIGGKLVWNKQADESQITGYNLYFLDANLQKVGSLATIGKNTWFSQYEIDLPNGVSIPQNAAYIGIFSKNATAESNGVTYLPIVDLGEFKVYPLVYTDTVVKGIADVNATVTVEANNTVIGTATAASDGSFSVTIPAQSGDTVLTVTEADSTGNVINSIQITVIKYATPTVNPVLDTDTEVTGTGEAGLTVVVSDKNLNKIATGVVQSDGTFTVTIPQQQASTLLLVNVGDSAGAKSLYSAVTVNSSTTPTSSSMTVNGVSETDTVVKGTAEANATVTVESSNTVIGTATAASDGSFSVTIPVQAANTVLTVTVTDSSGNVLHTIQITVSYAAPTVNPVLDTDTEVTGTGEAGLTVVVSDKNLNKIATGVVQSDGTFTVTIPQQPASTLLFVYEENSVGNRSSYSGVTVRSSTTTTSSAFSVFGVSDTDTAVSGTAEVNNTITVEASNTVIGTATAASDGSFSVTIPVQAANTVLTVTVTDSTGNVLHTIQITVEYATPRVNPVLDTDTEVTGTGEAGLTAVVSDENFTEIATGVVQSDGTFTVTIPKQQASTKLLVNEKDSAGNKSSYSVVTVQSSSTTSPTPTPTSPTSTTSPTPTPTGDTTDTSTSPDNTLLLKDSTTDTDADGKTIVTTKVDDKQLLDTIKKQFSDTTNNSKTVTVDVTTDGDTVQTELSGTAFQTLAEANTSSTMSVKTKLGTLNIPATTLKKAMEDLNISLDTSNVTVTVKKVDTQTETEVSKIIQDAGAVTVVQPIDFSITVTSNDGTKTEISSFTSFVGRTIDIPDSEKETSFSNLSGVMYDPISNNYFPVPTIFTTVDGKIVATLFRQGNSVYTVVKNKKQFNDVPANYFAKKDIDTLASKFVISGYKDGTFHYERNISRAEFATLMIRALGILPDHIAKSQFSDIQSSDWYAANVAAAVKAGLVHGYEDGTFRPTNNITRQEMVKMMYNALQVGGFTKTITAQEKATLLSKFKDKDAIPTWAKDAAAIAVKEGIVNGVDANTFAPETEANRGQSAAILYRMMKDLGFIN